MEIVLMVLAFGALMYFMMIRPAQKKMKEQQAMQSALGEGSRVMLTSGIFATVKHLGDQQAVVELAPGVDVTVVRGAIARTLGADEEEFEYEDAAPAADPAAPLAEVEYGYQAYAPSDEAQYSTRDQYYDPQDSDTSFSDGTVVDAQAVEADPHVVTDEPVVDERPAGWQDPYATGDSPRKDA